MKLKIKGMLTYKWKRQIMLDFVFTDTEMKWDWVKLMF
jgi:hypothetical protein